VKRPSASKNLCDAIVGYSFIMCTLKPLIAIFSGALYGAGAFLGGAIIVATCVFCEFYWSETCDV
jgi:hypothetical protein